MERNYRWLVDFRFIATAVSGSEHRVQRRFVRRFTADPRCELLFQTADNSAGGLFALGDVYVCPTVKEGVGLTITEAMCTGMPVVSTDYPTMNEWFSDGESMVFLPNLVQEHQESPYRGSHTEGEAKEERHSRAPSATQTYLCLYRLRYRKGH